MGPGINQRRHFTADLRPKPDYRGRGIRMAPPPDVGPRDFAAGCATLSRPITPGRVDTPPHAAGQAITAKEWVRVAGWGSGIPVVVSIDVYFF